MATLGYSHFSGPAPHRKPLPGPSYGSGGAADGITGNDQIYTRKSSGHSHTRSASSSLMPAQGQSQRFQSPQMQYTPQMSPQPQIPTQTRRTLSNATSSTSSSSPNGSTNLARAPTAPSITSSIRRSTSSRSSNATSYVALMRKQKATVWCDRAQTEDPRLLAQQRAAKKRANEEVVGGRQMVATRTSTSTGGGITGGVRSKIRHHGAVKASAYTGGPNLSGVGVPMRLSASEVDEERREEDYGYDLGNRYHSRNGSGRSSIGSGQRHMSYTASSSSVQPGQQLQASHQRESNGSTPSSAHSYSPADQSRNSSIVAKSAETPVPDTYASQGDYFDAGHGRGGQGTSGSSGSSEERGFGDVSGLPRRTQPEPAYKTKTSDDLRRRGSVDDRTMTMSGVRLFVANPDLSD